MTETTPQDTPGARDTWYLVAVGGLLVIIVASLAALWLLERNRRANAEQRLAERSEADPFMTALSGMGAAGPAGLPGALPERGISRSDILDRRPVELDGQPRKLWIITAEAGRRVGLQPGDLVEVAPAPRTQPGDAGP